MLPATENILETAVQNQIKNYFEENQAKQHSCKTTIQCVVQNWKKAR